MQGDPLERVCNSRQTEGVAWRRVRGERTIDRPSTRLTARSTVLEGTTPPRKPETILATWSGLAGDARTPDGRASDVAFLMRRGLDATQPSFALPSTLRRNEPHRHVGNMTACPVNKEPRTDRSWPSRCRRLPALAVRRLPRWRRAQSLRGSASRGRPERSTCPETLGRDTGPHGRTRPSARRRSSKRASGAESVSTGPRQAQTVPVQADFGSPRRFCTAKARQAIGAAWSLHDRPSADAADKRGRTPRGCCMTACPVLNSARVDHPSRRNVQK